MGRNDHLGLGTHGGTLGRGIYIHLPPPGIAKESDKIQGSKCQLITKYRYTTELDRRNISTAPAKSLGGSEENSMSSPVAG
jgi:hypothetical protein